MMMFSTGGDGNDLFVYTSLGDRGDIINDFEVGKNKIILTQLLKSLVNGGYNGTDAISPWLDAKRIANGYAQIVQSTGANNFSVQIDADGSSGRDIFRPFITLNVVGTGNFNSPKNFIF